QNTKVSHKPDHGYEGGMMNDTAYSLKEKKEKTRTEDTGKRKYEINTDKLISITAPKALNLHGLRHGVDHQGQPQAYAGYMGDSNYCMDIVLDEKGRWQSRVISTFEAYQYVREHGQEAGRAKLLDAQESIRPEADGSFKRLVMRLIRNDCVKFEHEGCMQLMRVVKMDQSGKITLAPIHEANVDARNRNNEDSFKYVYKTASSLQKSKGRKVTISPIGIVTDKGLKS
ncbi:MAG: type II CRISPR RNA-guided endonuclease Cas9, partial [Saezia sp.]